jgi:hypothetical protein
MRILKHAVGVFAIVLLLAVGSRAAVAAPPPQNPQSGSVGLEGQVPGSPPTTGATITVPGNGQSFSSTPITVAGICPKGLLVEIFKNNVFGGSIDCVNGSFSLQVDLFDGKNDLVARVYDSLNQSGPDSATVSVNYNPNSATILPRLLILTAYAKRGAQPDSTLSWPISISGGVGPYAVSVDWGDKTNADLISRSAAGDFDINHIYKQAGAYNVIIKVTDSKGAAAFLQVVGVGNGPIQQSTGSGSGTQTIIQVKIIWWPLIISVILIIVAFWLGKRQQIEQIRIRLRKGKAPF